MLQNMLNPEPTSTGIRSGNRVIGYSAAIRLLDNGRYDKHLADGMEILACIMEAVESYWLPCSSLRSGRKTELSTFRMILAVLILLLSIPASMAPLASIRDLNALHSPTILSWGQSRNMGQRLASSWRCGCIRTWLLLTKNLGSGYQHLAGRGLTSSMTALSNTSRSKVCQKHRLCIEGNDDE